MSEENIKPAKIGTVSGSTDHRPSHPGIQYGISQEQLEAAKRVLEAEIRKSHAGTQNQR